MTHEELQFLIAISGMSRYGPKYDIDNLLKKGVYKSKNISINALEFNIIPDDPLYAKHLSKVQEYMAKTYIKDEDSYIRVLEETIHGSSELKNLDKLMQLIRIMGIEKWEGKAHVFISNRPYPYEFVKVLEKYKNNWPKLGLNAYAYANAILLLRLGIGLGYILEAKQMKYLEIILEKVKANFQSFEQFGVEASIGRELDIKYTDFIRYGKMPKDSEDVLSIVYFGIWQYMEW